MAKNENKKRKVCRCVKGFGYANNHSAGQAPVVVLRSLYGKGLLEIGNLFDP